MARHAFWAVLLREFHLGEICTLLCLILLRRPIRCTSEWAKPLHSEPGLVRSSSGPDELNVLVWTGCVHDARHHRVQGEILI